MGKAAPEAAELVCPEPALPAEEVALRMADDALPPALDLAEEPDAPTELAAEEAEPSAPDAVLDSVFSPPEAVPVAEALAPLEKMVVLPIVLVMVLPSVTMVDKSSEVAIAPAPAYPGQ
jgi:hypothetical protein